MKSLEPFKNSMVSGFKSSLCALDKIRKILKI